MYVFHKYFNKFPMVCPIDEFMYVFTNTVHYSTVQYIKHYRTVLFSTVKYSSKKYQCVYIVPYASFLTTFI